MSYVVVQDLHPGRCRNYRHDNRDPLTGLSEIRRCLEMDLHYSPCVFDPPTERRTQHAQYIVSPNEPKPWTPRKPKEVLT